MSMNVKKKIKNIMLPMLSDDSSFLALMYEKYRKYKRKKKTERKFSKRTRLQRKQYKVAKPYLEDINALNERINYVKKLSEEGTAEKYCIIGKVSGPTQGLFACVSVVFTQIAYALAKGMIPVVDMQNHPYSYLEAHEVGKVNAWERYFKQPCGYGLNDIAGKKCIQLDSRTWREFFPFFYLRSDEKFDEYLRVWTILFENFFALSDTAKQYIEDEYHRLIKPGMRVVGAYCRGTDYNNSRAPGHAVQPGADEVIKKLKEVMPQWNCNYVYLTTDERRIVDEFENAFPGKVLTVNTLYYDGLGIDYTKEKITTVRFDRDNDAYLRGLQYLSSVVIFSKCTSAVIGVNAGSMGALYINGGKYENTYIFDLGFFPKTVIEF